jgi:hypothetical protein
MDIFGVNVYDLGKTAIYRIIDSIGKKKFKLLFKVIEFLLEFFYLISYIYFNNVEIVLILR